MKKWGNKVYVLAADYNYGQITAKWVAHYVEQRKGKTLATNFFPLDVSDFGSTIAKIQDAAPNFVVAALVGGAHMSFFRQWAASGMNKKIPLTSTTFGVGNEHLALSAAEGDGILIAGNYSPEDSTRPPTRSSWRRGPRSTATPRSCTNWRCRNTRASCCGPKRCESRHGRPRGVDQDARDRIEDRRSGRNRRRRSQDAPLRARHPSDGGQGPEAHHHATPRRNGRRRTRRSIAICRRTRTTTSNTRSRSKREHDPEKVDTGFPRRSCSTEKPEHDRGKGEAVFPRRSCSAPAIGRVIGWSSPTDPWNGLRGDRRS